jgi:gluconolactonase
MRIKELLAIIACVFGFGLLASEATPQTSQPDREVMVPGIPGVIAAGTRIEKVWTTETRSADGLLGHPNGSLLVPQQAISRIEQIEPNGAISTYLEETNGAGGIAIDAAGRVIAVERNTPRLEILAPERRILVDRYEGVPLEGASDIVVDRMGGVYFTEGRQTPPSSAVYYVSPNGQEVTRIISDIERANGITLSPDESVLYIADSPGEYLLAYEVQEDGTVRNRRNFARLVGGSGTGADGLAIDQEGRLYVATPIGIQVFNPQGQHLGTIPTPRSVTTMAFAGPDKQTLFFVGRGNDSPEGAGQFARSLYRIRMLASGFKGRAK